MPSSTTKPNCVVAPLRGGSREHHLVAARSFTQGEVVLCERPLVSVPVGRYRYGTYVWDMVDQLLSNPALLHEFNRWGLAACEVLVFPQDELVEKTLAAKHRKSRRLVHGLFLTVATNNVGQLDADRRVVGHAVYQLMSRSDHSCTPTTSLVPGETPSEGRLVAARDIRRGEAITWCYFQEGPFLAADFEERNLALVDMFRFACRCERCAAERPAHLAGEPDLVKYYDRLIRAEAQRLQTGEDASAPPSKVSAILARNLGHPAPGA